MSEKKKGILGKLFKGSSSCDCGVTIVEEKQDKKEDKKAKNNNKSK